MSNTKLPQYVPQCVGTASSCTQAIDNNNETNKATLARNIII